MKAALVVMVTLLTSSEAMLFNDVAMVNVPRTIGCTYMDQFYEPGSKILNAYDAASDTCYGFSCDENGYIITWHIPNCHPNTPPPPDEEPPITPPPPTTTPPPPNTTPLGCDYNGKWHAPGTLMSKGEDLINNWCWQMLCSEDGHILAADGTCYTTTPPTTTPPETPQPMPPLRRRLQKTIITK